MLETVEVTTTRCKISGDILGEALKESKGIKAMSLGCLQWMILSKCTPWSLRPREDGGRSLTRMSWARVARCTE